MIGEAAIFVSKRLQRVVLAMLCLTLVQAVTVLASCTPEPVAMTARVAITPE